MYNSLKTWNEEIWKTKKFGNNYKKCIENKNKYYMLKEICNTLKLSKILNGTCIITEQRKIITIMQEDFFAINEDKTLKKHYKNYFGLKREQLKKVYESALNCYKNVKFGIKVTKWNHNVFYFFDKNNKYDNIICIMMLLAKWKMNQSSNVMSSIFQVNVKCIRESIYKGTAFLRKYAIKWLINTKKKLSNEKPCKDIRNVMGITRNINVVNGDGIRLQCQSPEHFHSQQKTYDQKHKYNAYNCIGFNTLTGKYIGFYPKIGIGSDGHHWDGHVMDFIIFNNIDGILKWLDINSKRNLNDGTRIIFDRALARGCILFTNGVINFSTPCLQMHKKKNPYENNKSRTDATVSRWSIEKSFGNLGNIWIIFQSQKCGLNGYYVCVYGIWLDIAGAICNHLNIGLIETTYERKKQLKLMKYKNEQDLYDQYMNNHYINVINLFKDEKELKKYWIQVKNIKQLCEISTYWKRKYMYNLFNLTNKQMKLIGGGRYTVNMGKWYLTHSKYFIQIWISRLPGLKQYVMFRKIKPRMTREWDKKHAIVRGSNKKMHTTDDFDYIINGKKWISKFHTVLIGERDATRQIIPDENEFKFEKNELTIEYGCSCVHGSRTICGDSHVMCCLLYLKYLVNGQVPPDEFISEMKYAHLMDINFFKAYLKDLPLNVREIYIDEFMEKCKRNQVKPIYSNL